MGRRRKGPPTHFHGLLPVDKPSGPTSHDVVDAVRRKFQTRQVGHAGTLDPLASGIVLLLLGRATKLAQFIADDTKRYIATMKLGVQTNTDDITGDVISEKPIDGITADDVKISVASFVGDIKQVPPLFSAKHVNGKRAYELAREGVEFELPACNVKTHELNVLSISGAEVKLEMLCSSGYYVRSLIRDIGAKLGCGATMSALRRTAVGKLTLKESTTLEILQNPDIPREVILPPFSLPIFRPENV